MGVDYVLTIKGLPGYLFPYLIGYILIFLNAISVLRFVSSISLKINLSQVILINALSILAFHEGIFETHRIFAYPIGMISAFSIFCLAYNILHFTKSSKLIVFLSGICFEIYLVHEFFLGSQSVYIMFPNPIVGFIFLIIFSITAGVGSKWLSSLLPRRNS